MYFINLLETLLKDIVPQKAPATYRSPFY